MAPPVIWTSYKEWAAHRRKLRAARNKDRNQAIREGRASRHDGTSVDHKDFNPHNHKAKNKRVVTISENSRRSQPKRRR